MPARRLLSQGLLLPSLLVLGCSDEGTFDQPLPSAIFDPAITRVVLEVDYAEGAEPYTASPTGGDPWDLFAANAAALFGDKNIVFPRALSEMQAIGPASGRFDSDAILAFAESHRDQRSEGDTVTLYVIWLDGTYEQEGEERPEVLGVSIGNTGVIGMFKPTITSSGVGPIDVVPRYVEQATLVHEVGHAAGLVDNGLPLTSDHHDEAHAAHCSNEDCVMYYAVESLSGAVDFVQQYVTTNDAVLFDEACLADAAAAR